MSSQPRHAYTPQEYLQLERESETKNEYLRGEIFAMTGGSRAHSIITVNLVGVLMAQLESHPCTLYSNDMRIKVEATGLYTYPDASVGCGQPQLEDSHQDTLLNPRVIFEVLSPSTERYDRGVKFQHYQQIESLSDYILISQDQCRIEHLMRQADGSWRLTHAADANATLLLESIDCALPLGRIYNKVSFESADNA